MKKKVAFVISTLTGGGAQRVVSILTQALTVYYDIYLILHDGRKVTYPYSGELIDLETPVANKKIKKVLNFIKRLFGLKEIKRTIKFDVTISFMENSNFINLLTSVNDLRIISVRNYKSKQLNNLYGPLFKVLIKLLYKKSDLIVVPSTGIKNDLWKNFGLKKEIISVIHNPLDHAMIESMAREDLDLVEADLFKSPVIVAVGSLIEQKGHRHLIRSFKMINERMHDAKLLIIGEGNLKGELDKMVMDSGLAGQVNLIGFQQNPFKYLARSSIFVLSSLFEGFPNVLLEAMACGVPVISTDCPAGPREIISPGSGDRVVTDKIEYANYGILTPVFKDDCGNTNILLSLEEKLMAEAILTLLTDRSLYQKYKEKSRARAKDFSKEAIAEQWCHLIGNTTNEGCSIE